VFLVIANSNQLAVLQAFHYMSKGHMLTDVVTIIVNIVLVFG